MRRESIAFSSSYLNWAMQNEDLNPAPTKPKGDQDRNVETQHPGTRAKSPRYTIAKTCPYPTTTTDSIISDYGAVNFFPSLRSFLTLRSLLQPDFDLIDVPFPTFKRFTIYIPPIRHASSHPTPDVIRATIPQKSPNTRRKENLSISDTVLARKAPAMESETLQSQALDGMGFYISRTCHSLLIRSICWASEGDILTAG